MAENSAIEWTDHTFNPWIGCTKVSPGCDNCYAERTARRFGTQWGPHAARRSTSDSYWKQPLRWNTKAAKAGKTVRVFCASMADVFDNEAPAGARERLWGLIRATPNLTWLLLTKRIGNAAAMLPPDWGSGYANVGLGATAVNQDEIDRDLKKLVATPARFRFLSIEPMLSCIKLPRVDFHCYVCGGTGMLARWPKGTCGECHGVGFNPAISTDSRLGGPSTPMGRIDWVICGGESGPHARPIHPDWVRSLRDQCYAVGAAFFFKQWGEWAPHSAKAGGDEGGDLRRGHVRYLQGDGREFDGHFRRGDAAVAHVGKKAAGRTLDGREHSNFPETT
jgi:protein gp37